jgi:redox-sensing transcriptional repressor
MEPNEPTLTPASRPTLRRLPMYHSYLGKLAAKGRENVSCTRMAGELHLDPTQVRKDLSVTGAVGRPRVGFEVGSTIQAIENFLGWNNTNDAFLIGAGNLGSAILGYEGFRKHGVNIIAAFDTDPAKIGRPIHGREVYQLDRMVDLASRMNVLIGVLAVPAAAAQDVANLMVLSGIRAIWNLTPAWLDVPEGIIIEDVELSASLAVLSGRLADALRTPTSGGGR